MKLKPKKHSLESDFDQASTLFNAIQDATDKLAQLAQAELSNPDHYIYPYAAAQLAQVPQMSVRKALNVLLWLSRDAPCFLAGDLLSKMLYATDALEDAMRAHPKQFVHATRQLLYLPTVRSVRDNGRKFHKLAERVRTRCGLRFEGKGRD